jgi:hypothetical protein
MGFWESNAGFVRATSKWKKQIVTPMPRRFNNKISTKEIRKIELCH